MLLAAAQSGVDFRIRLESVEEGGDGSVEKGQTADRLCVVSGHGADINTRW